MNRQTNTKGGVLPTSLRKHLNGKGEEENKEEFVRLWREISLMHKYNGEYNALLYTL